MKNKNTGIGKIIYGNEQTYYPFFIKTHLNYKEIYDKIVSSEYIVNQKYYEKEQLKIKTQLSSINEKLKKQKKIKLSELYELTELEDAERTERFADILNLSNYEKELIIEGKILPTVFFEESSARINFNTKKGEYLDKLADFSDMQYAGLQNEAGFNFVNEQDRFLLIPLKVTLLDNSIHYISIHFYLFKNLMGIFKFDIPIENKDFSFFADNESEDFVKKIELEGYNLEFSGFNESIPFLARELFPKEAKILTSEIVTFTYLIDYEGNKNLQRNLTDDFVKDIYAWLRHPISEYALNNSHKDEMEKTVNDQRYKLSNVNYFLNDAGGGLVMLDKKDHDYYQVQIEDNNINHNQRYEDIITSNLMIMNEFAILLILMEKINNNIPYFYTTHGFKGGDAKYLENIIYFSNLKEGIKLNSIIEQTIAFEKRMNFYLNDSFVKARLRANNKLEELKDNKAKEDFNSILAIGGSIISFTFGLPSITETIKIIRGIIPVNTDVPYITIENTSFIIWLALNIYILWNIWKYINPKRFENIKEETRKSHS